jgi:cell division protein FtsB
MLEKLKSLQNHPKLTQFRDVRAIGLLVFLVIALMVSWSGAKVIQRNYELQKQISQMQQELEVQELENNNLKLQNQYFETDQYLELKARQDFGKGQPGEKLVLVPKEVAMAYVTAPQETKKISTPESHRPAYQRNFEMWVDFFLHRQSEN